MNTHLLSDIALFVEVVNAKSFTKAAEILSMPASTLSRRIAALERSIGFRLLNRTTRKVDVTEEGSAYFNRCKDLVAEANLAHEEISQSIHVAKGVLRLTCAPDFATYDIAPFLVEYAKKCPAVKVELSLSSRAEDLVSNHLDLAIRIGKLQDSSLIARPMGSLRQALYASQAFLANNPAIDLPADLMKVDCIRIKSGAAGSTWRLNHCHSTDSQKITIDGQYIAGGPIVAQQLVKLGLGVGLLPPSMAEQDLKLGRLVPVLPDWRATDVPVHALTTSRMITARVRIFIEMLTDNLKRLEASS